MIIGLRNEKPMLEFQLGATKRKAYIGEIVRVSLSSGYPSNYFLYLDSDLEVRKITDFVWDVVVKDAEPHSIRLFLSTIDKSIQKYSNILTINEK